jgi:hypothetical protein
VADINRRVVLRYHGIFENTLNRTARASTKARITAHESSESLLLPAGVLAGIGLLQMKLSKDLQRRQAIPAVSGIQFFLNRTFCISTAGPEKESAKTGPTAILKGRHPSES